MELPQDFIARLRSQLPEQHAELLAAFSLPAPVSLRANPAKVLRLACADPVPWADHACYLPERPRFTLDPWLHAGAYYVQEASSMLAGLALRQLAPAARRALDLCAAPGGKSTQLASLLPPSSLLVANEVIASRAAILAENLAKWGAGNALITQSDPRDFARLPGFFDLILADAPCSGEGLFRKDPGAAGEWSAEGAALCASRQRRILSDIWPALAPGGLLVYSTCTFNPEENEANLAWLMRETGALPERLRLDPAWGIEELEQGGAFGYACYPQRVRGEGFFLAALRKPGERAEGPERRQQVSWPEASRAERAQLAPWLAEADAWRYLRQGDAIRLLHAGAAEAALAAAKGLKVLQAGIEAAELTRKELKPLHPLALSGALAPGRREGSELDIEDALRYLRREDIRLEGEKGWQLLSFRGLPLGWAKQLGPRVNNYYPPEWRIRQQGMPDFLLADALAR
jgi:16S rRNA C967 or C1407 C5-methylase (RsmB/RsmF family)/NOL1/NOP2/fmu family ribosome biogenesis protein